MSTAPLESAPGTPPLEWRDKKRHLWLLGLIPPTSVFLAMAFVAAFNAIGHGFDAVSPVWWWIGPMLVYVLLPILDVFFGPPDARIRRKN